MNQMSIHRTASPRHRAWRWTVALAVSALLAGAPGARAATPDAWVTAKVKISLLTDSQIEGLDANVDTYDGTVTLHGQVASEPSKQRAEQVARKIQGVRDVRNLLAVVPEEKREQTALDDDALSERIAVVLERDQSLEDSQIRVKSVHRGVVVLSGDAHTLSDHLRAIEDARAVDGVTRVASEIRSPDALADGEIWRDEAKDSKAKDAAGAVESSARDAWTTAAVKLRLLGKREVPGLSINVDTQDGVVTLFGVVPTAEVSKLAEAEARSAGGVTRVENDLQVVAQEQKERVAARDDEITRRIEERVDGSPSLESADLGFEVHNGVVRVTGSVPSAQARLEVLTLARGTDGVRSVLDAMTVADSDKNTEDVGASAPTSR